jgi:hypothetical protein
LENNKKYQQGKSHSAAEDERENMRNNKNDRENNRQEVKEEPKTIFVPRAVSEFDLLNLINDKLDVLLSR